MVKNKLDNSKKPTMAIKQKEEILVELTSHYNDWKDDNEIRMHRDNGWNDITDAYYGRLPDDWPYNSHVVDPILSTTLIEKNARLLNSKLKGRLVPREGGDAVKARINNAVLDFQWDNANLSGSMLSKWSMMDMDTRLYGSKFALTCWKVIRDHDGKLIFEGNEFLPKDIRDCGMDPNCQNVKDAKWFQLREWMCVDDIEKANKNKEGVEIYKNIKELRDAINNASDRRDTEYLSRIKQLKGMEDRMGDDDSFQVVEIVTEYRPDRWITFAPKHNIILRDIKNPYKHGKIPIVQLKYYPLGDDPIGESEVERVLSLWRAIQSVINAHLDGMNVRMFPPLKIIEGQARIETLVYGPGAPWIMNQPNAVTEMNFGNGSLNEFQTNYSALKSAFNQAMGDLSQGVSNVDPNETDKTATEIKAVSRQQNIRDEKNQTDLGEAVADCMKMWLSNTQQFLFSDPDKHEHILRILGKDEFQYFKDLGMDEMELSQEAMMEIQQIIEASEGDIDDALLAEMTEAGKVPKYPVVENPYAKDPTKYKIKPKLDISKKGDYGELSVVPEDIDGVYDYIPDVKSMSVGSDMEHTMGMQRLFDTIMNPAVTQMLASEGVKINIQDLLVNLFNQYGTKDSDQYFSSINPQQMNPQIPQQIPQEGLSGTPVAPGVVAPGTDISNIAPDMQTAI